MIEEVNKDYSEMKLTTEMLRTNLAEVNERNHQLQIAYDRAIEKINEERTITRVELEAMLSNPIWSMSQKLSGLVGRMLDDPKCPLAMPSDDSIDLAKVLLDNENMRRYIGKNQEDQPEDSDSRKRARQ